MLYRLLTSGKLRSVCGERTLLLLLTDDQELIAFCTLAEYDDIQPTALTPWIGFVYTFPQYRGCRYAGKMLREAERIASNQSAQYVYISTGATGLYEKYGYDFLEIQKDISGEDSRVYRKILGNG